MPELNWIAIVAGALAAFFLGWLWYGLLFSKPFMAGHGIDPEGCKGGKGDMARVMTLNLLLMLVAAVAMDHVLGTYATRDSGLAVMVGGGIGLGFVATAIGTSYLYTQKSLQLFLIDAGYWTAAFALMAVVETVVR